MIESFAIVMSVLGLVGAGRRAVLATRSSRAQRRLSGASMLSASTTMFTLELDRLAAGVPIPAVVRHAIARAAPTLPAGGVMVAWALSTVLSGVVGLARGGAAFGAIGLVVGFAGPAAALVTLRHREDALIEAALPDALESIGRSTRSGASLTQALVEARDGLEGPIVSDLHRLTESIRLGRPVQESFDAWVLHRPLNSVRLAAAALIFGAETGGASSRAVDGLAASLRDRAALSREVAALASQARMSAVVIAVLPVAFLLLSSGSDDRVAHFLFATGLGRLCLVVGLTLDVVGLLWMRRMTASIQ